MQVVWCIVIALCSFVVGVIARYIYERSKKQATDGKLIWSIDPDDGPYFFLEFEKSYEPIRIIKQKYVVFEVAQNDIISHE